MPRDLIPEDVLAKIHDARFLKALLDAPEHEVAYYSEAVYSGEVQGGKTEPDFSEPLPVTWINLGISLQRAGGAANVRGSRVNHHVGRSLDGTLWWTWSERLYLDPEAAK